MKKHLHPIAFAAACVIAQSCSLVMAQSLTVPRSDDTRGLPIQSQIGGAAQLQVQTPVALTATNARIGQIIVTAKSDRLIADGQTQMPIEIQVLGKNGQPLNDEVILTLEVTHGLINLKPESPLRSVPDKNDRLVTEAEAADLDELTPGIQIKVKGGLKLAVVAPFELKDVIFRVTGGLAEHQVKIKAVPELRDMIAVGVIEGQLRLNQLSKNLVPANEGDLFERELRQINREFASGQGSVGGRAAFFLKGKILGEYLLTASADSEKLTNGRMFRDIDPNAFYPVYGDSSIRGADAQTRGRLFVRVDKDRSYLLFGDYTTANSTDLMQLGNYSRAATGLKWHAEDIKNSYQLNAFASHTQLTQVIDEIPGRGISGPYGVSNPNGVAGTERVEIIVRDRNQPQLILKTTSLVRGGDYEFEPFSGKILFKAAVPSVDENLNPVSIRISYEVEQGGDRYWVAGVNGEWQALSGLRLGASYAKDQNPTQPYSLASISAKAQISSNIRLTAEIAQSQGHTGSALTSSSAAINATKGNAARVQLDIGSAANLAQTLTPQAFNAQIKWQRTDIGFENPSANMGAGRTELNARASYQLDAPSAVRAQVLRSQDDVTGAKRDAASLEYDRKLGSSWGLKIGIKHAKDEAGNAQAATNLGASSGICANSSIGNTGFNGGFGVASSTGATDSLCNNGSRFPVAAGSIAAANPGTTIDSVYAKLQYQKPETDAQGKALPPRWTAFVEAEADVHDTNKHRLGAGLSYQLGERSRIYLRGEDISSVTGDNGLTPNAHQRAFALGVASTYAENAQAYNEYRLSSGTTGQQAENAFGLRNTFLIRPGLKLMTQAELIKVMSGTGSDAKSLGVGLDYTALATTKAAGRIEWRQDDSATNLLSTLRLSQKLNDNWSVLGQNYFNQTENRTSTGGKKTEDRFIIGAAYRPIMTNFYNWLGKYEHRTEKDSLPNVTQPYRKVDILSMHADWHPNRVWHLNGRVAYKNVREGFATSTGGVTDSRFSAGLISGRVMYDITERWSVGGMLTAMQQTQPGSALQYGYGLEVGHAVVSNLWANLGYTWRGLNEKDMVSNEFRNRGFFFGLRYKFDENIFNGDKPVVNRSLDRP